MDEGLMNAYDEVIDAARQYCDAKDKNGNPIRAYFHKLEAAIDRLDRLLQVDDT